MAFNSKRTACYIHMKRGSHGPYMSFSVHKWHVSGGQSLPHPPNPSSVHPFAEPNTETKREYRNFHSLVLAVQTHRALRVLGRLALLLAFGIGVPAG